MTELELIFGRLMILADMIESKTAEAPILQLESVIREIERILIYAAKADRFSEQDWPRLRQLHGQPIQVMYDFRHNGHDMLSSLRLVLAPIAGAEVISNSNESQRSAPLLHLRHSYQS